jgi:hypothetical protein
MLDNVPFWRAERDKSKRLHQQTYLALFKLRVFWDVWGRLLGGIKRTKGKKGQRSAFAPLP